MGIGIDSKELQRVTILLLLLALLPSSMHSQGVPESTRRIAQENQIREAVIRYQMEEWRRNMNTYEAQAKEQWEKETAKEKNYKVYFISINGRDPSDEFMKRFSAIPRLVKKASMAQMRNSHSAGVIDRETDQTGIIFSANTVRWVKSDSVEVEGGYYCGTLCASARTFAVHLEAGKWAAKLLRVNAVS